MSGKNRDLENRFGVSEVKLSRPGSPTWEEDRKNREDYKQNMIEGARNDYDLRRTMEAAAMSGDKKASKLQKKGFRGIDDVRKWQDFSEKAADKHGQGGAFDSASDYMGLTKSMVIQDRNEQTAAYDEKYAKTTDLNALKDKLMAEATDKAVGNPIEPSDRMAAVEDRLEKAAGGSMNRPPSLFDKDNAQPAKADDQADAARNFLNDYTADVREGANIRSDIDTGVSNAARHVQDTYGR